MPDSLRVGRARPKRYTAVDAEDVASDEDAAGPEQVQDRFVELALATAASERDAAHEELGELLRIVAELGGHLGGEEARSDGVDADPVSPPLRGELAREPDDARLRGHVGGVGDL